jgi:hypothetical protein
MSDGTLMLERMNGWLYFIQCCNHDSFIKIGHAAPDGLERRLDALQVGCPYPLRLVSATFHEDVRRVERAAHESVEAQRIRGEWFSSALLPVARDIATEQRRAIMAFCMRKT